MPTQKASTVAALMLAKLKASGLEKQVKLLGFTPLLGEQAASRYPGVTDKARDGFLIPYYNVSGKPLPFFRYRYLTPPTGFNGLVANPQRYTQPAGVSTPVY